MKDKSNSTTVGVIQKKHVVDEGLTRRRFIQAGASATIAASLLPMLNLRGAGVAR